MQFRHVFGRSSRSSGSSRRWSWAWRWRGWRPSW